MTTYSFCEPSHAVGRWHIRILSAAGPKYGGGIDTPSLCGRVTPFGNGGSGGWDVRHEVTPESVERIKPCQQCAAKYRSAVGAHDGEAFLRKHPELDYDALEREALADPVVRAAYEKARERRR